MTVKDFLKVFKNPAVTVEIKDESDELVAKTYADGKDVLNAEISAREVRLVKLVNMNHVDIAVKNVEDAEPNNADTPIVPDNTDPTDSTTNTDPVDPTGTP